MWGKVSKEEYEQYVREVIKEIREERHNELSITIILDIVKEWISDNKSQWRPGLIARDKDCKKTEPNADDAVCWNTLGFFARVDYLLAEDPAFYDDQLIEHAKWAFAIGAYNPTIQTIIELSNNNQKNEIKHTIIDLDRTGELRSVIDQLDLAVVNTRGY